MTKMTRVERKVLANQYIILETLNPDRAAEYKVLREIVEHGFEDDYEDVLQGVYNEPDTMSVEECRYVGDVLHMYDMMQTAYKNKETAGVDPTRLRFPGFDGNHEGKFVSYAQHMRNAGKWTFLDLVSTDFNSHFPTKEKYTQMLDEWNKSKDKHRLMAADILRILG